MQSAKSKRILKLIRKNINMTDEQIARKIGAPNDIERVTKERQGLIERGRKHILEQRAKSPFYQILKKHLE